MFFARMQIALTALLMLFSYAASGQIFPQAALDANKASAVSTKQNSDVSRGRTVGNTQTSKPGDDAIGTGKTPAADAALQMPRQSHSMSDVFGAQLFTGAFSQSSYSGFNPNHIIGVGDGITLKMWGAYELEAVLTVDAQGNIFIPRVGPVRLLGVRNADLPQVVQRKIGEVYRSNVESYVNLAVAQPVRIFVTGFVMQPGQYSGLSSDSILHYLDRAGGIDPERGSFINVRVQRGQTVRTQFNLYEFLLKGTSPDLLLADGDTIVVGPRQSGVKVRGLVQNEKRFEFKGESAQLDQVLEMARVAPAATHVRITRNSGTIRNVEHFEIEQASAVILRDGDDVHVTADKKPGTITVRVEGEHSSAQEYVMAYGSRLGNLLEQVQFNAMSDIASIQLFRTSVKERQREMLKQSLHALEQSVLTAHSATNSEIELRKGEADLVLKWIERAREIEPKGQVVLSRSDRAEDLTLENGDILVVPKADNVVMISGEVMFPTATVHDARLGLMDYVGQAGGYSQNAKSSQIAILHRDGSFSRAKEGGWMSEPNAEISPGDEILVMPKVDVKSVQITKDLTQILYQIAVSAAVVLAL